MKYEIYIYEEAKTASFYKKAIAEYEKRLSRYCKISCRFIKKEKEWEKLLTEARGKNAFLYRELTSLPRKRAMQKKEKRRS